MQKMILERKLVDMRRNGKPREMWMDGVRRGMISKALTEDADDRELCLNKIYLG